MAYSVGNTISAGDLNLFNTKINNFFWGEGFTSNGYGQTPLFSNYNVSGQPITAAPWKQTVDTVENALKHQGTAYSMMYPPTKGQRIEARLTTNYDLAVANKFNAATTGVPVSTSITSTQSFNNTQLITMIAYFGTGADVASHNKARYFFNAGGQFNISLSHPSPMSTISANLGSIRFGAGNQKIAGVNYTGTTKVGGTMNDYSVLQSSKCFYNLVPGGIPGEGYTTSDVILAVQGEIGTTASIYVYVKYNNLGLLTFRIASYAAASNPTIPAGSFAQLTAIQPPTTYITNSWGPITIGTDITQTNVATTAPQWYLYGTSGSLVVPTGRTTARVVLIGGGGCGETATGATIKGGGGGGGGQVRDIPSFPVTAGSTLTWTVGAGGQGFQGYGGNGVQTVFYGSSTQTAAGGTRGGGIDGSGVLGQGGGSGSGYTGGLAYIYGRRVYGGGGGGGDQYFGFNAGQAGTVFQGSGGIGGVGSTVGPVNGFNYNVGGGGEGGMTTRLIDWTTNDETGYRYGGGRGGLMTADGGNGTAGTGGGGGGGAQNTILDGTEPIVGGNGGSGFVAIYM